MHINLFFSGGRYSYITEGLRINNITEADNGLYSCRAEVATEGRFDSRPITVEVHSEWTIEAEKCSQNYLTLINYKE